MIPPVGKSGAFTNSQSSSIVISSFSKQAITPLITSDKLCGSMFVAIPTAIPEAPFTNKLGIRVGRTVGSLSVSSKFKSKSTVSFAMSPKKSSAIRIILASV